MQTVRTHTRRGSHVQSHRRLPAIRGDVQALGYALRHNVYYDGRINWSDSDQQAIDALAQVGQHVIVQDEEALDLVAAITPLRDSSDIAAAKALAERDPRFVVFTLAASEVHVFRNGASGFRRAYINDINELFGDPS